MRITDGLYHRAACDPDRPAIVRGAQRLDYASLARRVDGVAAGVRDRLGNDAGRRPVGLLLDDPVEFLVGFLGAVQGGGIAAPLSPAWRDAELRRALALCDPAFVVGDGRSSLPLAALERPAAAHVDLDASPSEPFYIGFTSGSTGGPKGAVRTHDAWVRSFFGMTVEFGVGPGERVVVPGSLFFSFSLIAALHALFVGGTVVLPARPQPRSLLRTLSDGGGTLYVLPSFLAETLRLAEARSLRFPAVRRIITAGEKLQIRTKREVAAVFPAAELFEYYGASELGYVTVAGPDDHARRPDSVGRPFFGAQVAVLDGSGVPVPAGEIGLLCARSSYGFAGYWRQPELEASVEHHGWRTAGDLARLDDAGYVYLMGRRDNMAVIHGENVYPEEVEAVLESLPGVHRAAVVPEPPAEPSHVVALVVPGSPAPAATAILRACGERLSARKTPRRVLFVEELPLTATGKVDRAGLRGLLRGGATGE